MNKASDKATEYNSSISVEKNIQTTPRNANIYEWRQRLKIIPTITISRPKRHAYSQRPEDKKSCPLTLCQSVKIQGKSGGKCVRDHVTLSYDT